MTNQQEIKEEILEGEKLQIIVFELGNEEYAFPIDQVKEIVRTPSITKVPLSEDYVAGIANIRGQTITVLDLEKKFELKTKGTSTEESSYTLVIECQDYQVGVQVSKMPNTLAVFESQIGAPSNVVQHTSLNSSVIKGIINDSDRMIILLDIISMLQVEDVKI